MSLGTKEIEVILASTLDGEIGYKNSIPWRLKGDLKRFKDITMGHTVIMGKNTFESLPKPLDGRVVIVVSTTLARPSQEGDDTHFVSSLDAAIYLTKLSRDLLNRRIFIAGGVRLYEEALKFADIVHLTTVYKKSINGYDAVINDFNMCVFDLETLPEVILKLMKRQV